MYQYIMTMQSYDDIAKEILSPIQLKFYKVKVRAFMTIIAKKLKKDEKVIQTIDEKDKKVFVEESKDKDYLEKEKKKLEKFLYADSSEITKESNEYNVLTSDRMVQKLNKKTHKFTEGMKNKAIKVVLGETTVLSFFNRIGIAINLEVKKKINED